MEEHKVYHIREIGNESTEYGYIGVTNNISNRTRQHRHKGQHYILTSPDGESFYVDALTVFCAEHDLTPQNLRKVANGQRRYHKGWTARKITEPNGWTER